jgi:hypothetical protein
VIFLSSQNIIVSNAISQPIKHFKSLLKKTLEELYTRYQNNQAIFENGNDKFFERQVFSAMSEVAKSTAFEKTISLYSGHKFPDIVAKKYYGVEVKSIKNNSWTSTGNSVLEGCRIDDVSRIFIMCGKLISPCEFRFRKYEDCLSDIAITHSPRYLVNMTTKRNETIFQKMGISYDRFRNLEKPIARFIDYYKKNHSDSEAMWWIGYDGEEKAVPLEVDRWSALPKEKQKRLIALSMVKFPQILGTSQDKYERLAMYLLKEENVMCASLRDIFTAGGQVVLSLANTEYTEVPRIFQKMDKFLTLIFRELEESNPAYSLGKWLQDIKPYIKNHNSLPITFFDNLESHIKGKYEEFLKVGEEFSE